MNKRIIFFADLKQLLVYTGAETPALVFKRVITIAKLALQVQGIVTLLITAFNILGPVAVVHAAIRAVVYLAVGVYLYKKGIAAKGKVIQRVSEQLLIYRIRLLLPLALQKSCALSLQVWVKRTGTEA